MREGRQVKGLRVLLQVQVLQREVDSERFFVTLVTQVLLTSTSTFLTLRNSPPGPSPCRLHSGLVSYLLKFPLSSTQVLPSKDFLQMLLFYDESKIMYSFVLIMGERMGFRSSLLRGLTSDFGGGSPPVRVVVLSHVTPLVVVTTSDQTSPSLSPV